MDFGLFFFFFLLCQKLFFFNWFAEIALKRTLPTSFVLPYHFLVLFHIFSCILFAPDLCPLCAEKIFYAENFTTPKKSVSSATAIHSKSLRVGWSWHTVACWEAWHTLGEIHRIFGTLIEKHTALSPSLIGGKVHFVEACIVQRMGNTMSTSNILHNSKKLKGNLFLRAPIVIGSVSHEQSPQPSENEPRLIDWISRSHTLKLGMPLQL